MIVVLAEKPSVGKDIARVLGASQRNDGYYSGNGYAVTWAFGHLVSLAMPQDYGLSRPSAANLPLIPENFQLVPKKMKTASGYGIDPGAAKQLKVISSLLDACEKIIVATDAGREGELIFRYIYYFLKCRKPFYRLWINSLTDQAIRTGFESIRPGQDYDPLFSAATARAKADWLVGINASQALAISSGIYNSSLGRVQTLTLCMIARRFKENKGFLVSPFWQAKIGADNNGLTSHFILKERLLDKETAGKLYESLKKETSIKVTKIQTRTASEAPPLLYDLTSLQRDANRYHNLGAAKTLTIAQRLYEHKFISYPRTGSRYLSDDVFAEIPILFEKLAAVEGYEKRVAMLNMQSLSTGSVNTQKVTDHHALITTGVTPSALSPDEKIVYNLIAGRMIEAFMPPCIKEVTEAEGECMALVFTAKNVTVLEKGWKEVLSREEDKEEEDFSTTLKNPLTGISKGDTLVVSAVTLLARKTTPPPLYTEGTLLSAMETAGKELEDESQRERLKDLGIGTPATRASIIETLYKRAYIEQKGKSIIPTERGLYVYEAVKDMQIADVQMTGSWEKTLYDIENQKSEYESFMEAIKIYTAQVTKEILSIPTPTSHLKGHPCPKCKNGTVHFRPKSLKCDHPDCDFILFRTVASKELSETNLIDLLEKGKTGLIKGFTSKKKGTSFDATLFLDDRYQLDMEYPPRKDKPKGKK